MQWAQRAEPEFVQLLTPDGTRLDHPEYDISLTDHELRGLYQDLVIVRRLDTEATALQRQGELGLWASALGQEAAQIGSGRAVRPQDMIFPTYREHGVLYCRGLDAIQLMGLFRGVDYGTWNPAETGVHLYTLVIGAQTLHATGYAMGVLRDGAVGDDDGQAVLAFFGDGATSQGDVNESLGWASVFNAPVVFFCQNNQYAISQPAARQSKTPLVNRAAGFGMAGIRVDGNDVLAVLAVTRSALDDARRGQGPSLIEAYTYRLGAHTTSDDPTRYRPSGEVEAWREKDPVVRLRRLLEQHQLGDAGYFAEVDADAQHRATQLRERVLALPDPAPSSLFDHVYAEASPALEAQRAEFVRYHASFEADAFGEGEPRWAKH